MGTYAVRIDMQDRYRLDPALPELGRSFPPYADWSSALRVAVLKRAPSGGTRNAERRIGTRDRPGGPGPSPAPLPDPALPYGGDPRTALPLPTAALPASRGQG